MGPKKSKKVFRILFSTASGTGKSEITLQGGDFWFRFWNPAIKAQNVNLQRVRVGNRKQQVQMGPRSEGKKIQSGCMGKNRKADLHG